VRARVSLADQGFSPNMTLNVPFVADLSQALNGDAALALSPLPISIQEGRTTVWRGENVKIDLALPEHLAEADTVPMAELRNPAHGDLQAQVFEQVDGNLTRRGMGAEHVRFTSKSMGESAGLKESPALDEIERRFGKAAKNLSPNPNDAKNLDELFEGRISRQAGALVGLGMEERIPHLLEASARLVKTGEVLASPDVHTEVKDWLLNSSVLTTIAGAKSATRLPASGGRYGASYLSTERGVAALAEVLGWISPKLFLMQSPGDLIVFDIDAMSRVMLEEANFSRFRLWGDVTASNKIAAFQDEIGRILNAPLSYRAEEGLLLGFPLQAVLDFAQRGGRRGATPHYVQIAGDYGLDDVGWGAIRLLSGGGQRRDGDDNLSSIVWYDSVMSLARFYLARLRGTYPAAPRVPPRASPRSPGR